MSHVKMGTMYVNQLMCTCTICCHMGKMSDGPVKVGENDCWAQCHMGTMSRFGVIWAQCHLALPIWHRDLLHQSEWSPWPTKGEFQNQQSSPSPSSDKLAF